MTHKRRNHIQLDEFKPENTAAMEMHSKELPGLMKYMLEWNS